ncbi:putative dynein light chain type 1 [Phytophthora cinnamomi]|uniref:putative dynein light chain type 1 n=1 Tax=Phytophthora cinnamomi TaxID=4785 RepID=UPI0035597E1B|nr:putative dynein light chain type 1 [Phytophthora cinnamomi]
MASMRKDKFYKSVVLVEDITDAMLDKVITFSTITEFVRRSMGEEYGRAWKCVMGSSFDVYVTHAIKIYVYFGMTSGFACSPGEGSWPSALPSAQFYLQVAPSTK